MLKNPAYKGFAAFGKTRNGPRKAALRPQRRYEQSKRDFSIYQVPEEEQQSIPVPAIVSEDLFETGSQDLLGLFKTEVHQTDQPHIFEIDAAIPGDGGLFPELGVPQMVMMISSPGPTR